MRHGLGIVALCGMLLIGHVSPADEARTDANIVTGLDVSDSIDAQETQLEIEGMARAIRSPEFLSAVQQGRHGRVGFTVFLWADGSYPVFASWKVIGSREEAQAVSEEMLSRVEAITASDFAKLGSLTDVSAAMEYAAGMLTMAPFPADRAIVNIISDGVDNVAEGPQRIRDQLVARGVTINGVVLGNDPPLLGYYRSEVIGGPRSFALAVDNRENLVEVLAKKFVTEIALNVEQVNQSHPQARARTVKAQRGRINMAHVTSAITSGIERSNMA